MELIRNNTARAKEWWVCYTAAGSLICCIIFITVLLLLQTGEVCLVGFLPEGFLPERVRVRVRVRVGKASWQKAFKVNFSSSSHCQAQAPDATLCPLQLDTSTMTSPSPAALPTPFTVAWAAPVSCYVSTCKTVTCLRVLSVILVRSFPEFIWSLNLLLTFLMLNAVLLWGLTVPFDDCLCTAFFCSGLCWLQPRTKVPHWRKGHSVWPDGNPLLLHFRQRKAHREQRW